jgi:hypothetical protein
MPARLAVLHHAKSFFPPDLREAVGDAAELLWVLLDPTDGDERTRRLLGRLGSVVEISVADLDAAAETLAAHRPEGIVTFVDDNLVVAAELAARLGLTYHTPQVARTLASKTLQRQALQVAGVPGPRFWPLPAGLTEAELVTLADSIGYPAVLKPVLGSGSVGILSLAGPADLVAAYCPGLEHVVEEHLADDPSCDLRFASYLSVETVVSHGRRTHVAITGRFPLAEPFRETGNFIPAAVESSMHGPLFDLTDAAITALGITTGVLHTEIKLTPDGPQLIEVNGRLGGRPPFVLKQISDVNLFRAACEVALGQPVSISGLAPCQGVAYWRMLQPPCTASRVRAVVGLGELGQAPFVDSVSLSRSPGDAVDWRDGTGGQVVTIRGRVADLDSLSDAIGSIERTVAIAYDG